MSEPTTPLPPACADPGCTWASIPHVHEGRAIYPAPPDDPQWIIALEWEMAREKASAATGLD